MKEDTDADTDTHNSFRQHLEEKKGRESAKKKLLHIQTHTHSDETLIHKGQESAKKDTHTYTYRHRHRHAYTYRHTHTHTLI